MGDTGLPHGLDLYDRLNPIYVCKGVQFPCVLEVFLLNSFETRGFNASYEAMDRIGLEPMTIRL